MNYFLSRTGVEMIKACWNNDMRLYAIMMMFPHASVAPEVVRYEIVNGEVLFKLLDSVLGISPAPRFYSSCLQRITS